MIRFWQSKPKRETDQKKIEDRTEDTYSYEEKNKLEERTENTIKYEKEDKIKMDSANIKKTPINTSQYDFHNIAYWIMSAIGVGMLIIVVLKEGCSL